MTITGGSSLRKSRHMTQSTRDYMAVVPIFVNAGSAILPAIAAPIVSGLPLLLKPRELVAVCRSRPLGTIVTILLLAILVAGGVWLLHGTSASARVRPTEHPLRNELKIDWHQEALRILNGEQPLGLNATFAPTPWPGPPNPHRRAPPYSEEITLAAVTTADPRPCSCVHRGRSIQMMTPSTSPRQSSSANGSTPPPAS